MTTEEMILAIVGNLVIWLPLIALWVWFFITQLDEFSTTRLPRFENKNMIKDIDKEISRLNKNYQKIEIKKRVYPSKVKKLDKKLDDIFFEIKALTDLKFKIEDNAKEDYLHHSLEEELAWCERVKRKHSLRIKNEDKRIDKELISKRGAYEKKQRKET